MATANKYLVKVLSRKDLLIAVELGFTVSVGESIVHRPKHGNCEIRARRLPHGVELKWAQPGTFYNPKVK